MTDESDDSLLPSPPRWHASAPPPVTSPASQSRPADESYTSAASITRAPDGGDDDPVAAADENDLGLTETMREVRRAFFSRDLIAPAHGLWPFGANARRRRERQAEIASLTAQRQARLRRLATIRERRLGQPRSWRPVDRKARLRVIVIWLVVVTAVVVVLWRTGTGSDNDHAPVSSAPSASTTASPSTTASVPPTTAGTSLPAMAPIPSGGVTALSPPPPSPPLDPTAITTVQPVVTDPSPDDLATPAAAARAWLARWCAFTFTDTFGAAEQRAKPAMTELGWNQFDPAPNERARHSWDRTVAAKETGRCSQPQAQIPPGAPASERSAIVLVWADRVVTSPSAEPYAERVMQQRIVLRGHDGRWRVDTATVGG